MYVCMYACVWMRMYAYVCVCMHACMHVCNMHIYIYMLIPPPGPTFFPITLTVSLQGQPSAICYLPKNNKLRWYPQQPQRFIFTNLSEACCEAKRWKRLRWVSVSEMAALPPLSASIWQFSWNIVITKTCVCAICATQVQLQNQRLHSATILETVKLSIAEWCLLLHP